MKDIPKNASEGSMEEVEANVEALMEKYQHLAGGEKTPPPMELPTAAEEEALDILKANAIREKISSENFAEGLVKELSDLEKLAEYNRKKDEEKERSDLILAANKDRIDTTATVRPPARRQNPPSEGAAA